MIFPCVKLGSTSRLMTQFGEFQMFGFMGNDPNSPISALIVGNPAKAKWPLVHVYSKCTTSESFGSLQCDCKEQLEYSMLKIQEEKNGIIVYLDQEARGHGLAAKLKIYQLMQEENLTSDEACESLGLPIDARNYDEAASILNEFGLKQIRLITNNPQKVIALQRWDVVVERVRIPVQINKFSQEYLMEKQLRHNHDIGLQLPDLERF